MSTFWQVSSLIQPPTISLSCLLFCFSFFLSLSYLVFAVCKVFPPTRLSREPNTYLTVFSTHTHSSPFISQTSHVFPTRCLLLCLPPLLAACEWGEERVREMKLWGGDSRATFKMWCMDTNHVTRRLCQCAEWYQQSTTDLRRNKVVIIRTLVLTYRPALHSIHHSASIPLFTTLFSQRNSLWRSPIVARGTVLPGRSSDLSSCGFTHWHTHHHSITVKPSVKAVRRK